MHKQKTRVLITPGLLIHSLTIRKISDIYWLHSQKAFVALTIPTIKTCGTEPVVPRPVKLKSTICSISLWNLLYRQISMFWFCVSLRMRLKIGGKKHWETAGEDRFHLNIAKTTAQSTLKLLYDLTHTFQKSDIKFLHLNISQSNYIVKKPPSSN